MEEDHYPIFSHCGLRESKPGFEISSTLCFPVWARAYIFRRGVFFANSSRASFGAKNDISGLRFPVKKRRVLTWGGNQATHHAKMWSEEEDGRREGGKKSQVSEMPQTENKNERGAINRRGVKLRARQSTWKFVFSTSFSQTPRQNVPCSTLWCNYHHLLSL